VRLHLGVPGGVIFDGVVTRLQIEGSAGHACLLPRHADLVTDLVPGLLRAVAPDGTRLFAVDHGVLVKAGAEVRILCRRALAVPSYEEAAAVIAEHFERLGEREERARATLARLESDVVRELSRLRGDHGRI
jgi:F-type H+-transporting ATPase subunit epsilon